MGGEHFLWEEHYEGEHFLREEHNGENTFWGKNTVGENTFCEKNTLGRTLFFYNDNVRLIETWPIIEEFGSDYAGEAIISIIWRHVNIFPNHYVITRTFLMESCTTLINFSVGKEE